MACDLAVGAFKGRAFDLGMRMLGKSSYECEGGGGNAISYLLSSELTMS